VKLSLGPVQYFWPRERVFEFYREVEGMPVDVVYLGEVVCSKRRALRLEDWLAIGERLASAGKEVVVSTLALLEAESERSALARVVRCTALPIEANDMAAVNILDGERRFVVGPHVNVYNARTLGVLARAGAYRCVMPVELDAGTLRALSRDRPAELQIELFAYGPLPLSFSARCFTARAYDLPKDRCEFRCGDHPAGIVLHTKDEQPFLRLNGIQVQSASTVNLVGEIDALREAGVDVLRVSPQPRGTAQVVDAFRASVGGALAGDRAVAATVALMDGPPCNGYWRGLPGMTWGE